jgi:hypothetical protein
MTRDYRPMMPEERIEVIRTWHEHGYEMQRASLPKRMSFMGLDLQIGQEVFAPESAGSSHGTSADIDYLYSLIRKVGMKQEVRPYGEVTRDGFTARYYIIKLTVQLTPGAGNSGQLARDPGRVRRSSASWTVGRSGQPRRNAQRRRHAETSSSASVLRAARPRLREYPGKCRAWQTRRDRA